MKLEDIMDPQWDRSSLEKSVSMARGRARALPARFSAGLAGLGRGGGGTCCSGWVQALWLLPQQRFAAPAETPAAVCCRQLPAGQGSRRHESPRQGPCLEGGKMKKALQLLNSWGMKKPLLTAAET